MSYGGTLTYIDGSLRVGCWSCEWVGSVSGLEEVEIDQAEAELHEQGCPLCGALELHAFGEFGCWPSEVGEPPCRRA